MRIKDVVIVGAGAAGLYAADRLHRAGLSLTVLEAADRPGGRVSSRPERASGLGLTIDEGANLINSTDRLAIGLMDRFGIPYVRRLRADADHMNFFFGGEILDQEAMDRLIFAENPDCLAVMIEDQRAWMAHADPSTEDRFVDESIAAYLERLGAAPSLVTLLRSFFWSEYGHTLADLNLHVLFDYLRLDAEGRSFRLIPNVDESYTVPDGTAALVTHLEERVHGQIRYGRRVFRIEDDEGEGTVVIRARDRREREEEVRARTVVFAAPLHSLRSIWVSMRGLSPKTLNAARAATYAHGAKLHLKFSHGFHALYRFTGILTTDTGEQIWASSTGQGGAGLITVLTGPLPWGEAATMARAQAALAIIERAAPGTAALFVGAERSDAPLSYSGSLRPGERRDLAIHDGSRQWMTIGEASGGELQGYLEGAFRSADRAATRLICRHRSMMDPSRSPLDGACANAAPATDRATAIDTPA